MDFRDFFQWDRFIAPSVIKIFYWLAIAMAALYALSGIVAGIALLVIQPVNGVVLLIGSVLGFLLAVVIARIAAEYVLVMFRINDHLGAIRQQGEP